MFGCISDGGVGASHWQLALVSLSSTVSILAVVGVLFLLGSKLGGWDWSGRIEKLGWNIVREGCTAA